jgi:hypothetical protein
MNTTNTIQLALAAGLVLSATGCNSNSARRAVEAPTNYAIADESTPVEAAAEEVEAYSFDIAFGTHLDMNLPEQDVYIEREAGSSEVWRVTKGDNNMNAELYKTAVETKHDPFDPKALGPHAKGEPMGMTLGQWLKHQGVGTYSCTGNVGTLQLSFSGLVPNGVYTMWHAFIALPPTTPFSGTLDLPLGARDGSESVFSADAGGNAQFEHTFTPGLEMSDVWTTAMLAINYHSDGKTYGGVPGNFGINAHIPLFVMLPSRDGIQ